MLTTNDEELARKLKRCAFTDRSKNTSTSGPGMNSRLDALQAAVLDVKLDHLDAWSRARQRNAALYREALAGIVTIARSAAVSDQPRLQSVRDPLRRRDELRKFLSGIGVGTEVYYPLAAALATRAGRLWVQSRRFPGE